MIPIDKKYHFIAGFLIYTFAQLFMPIFWALIPVIVIGTLKEVWDYLSHKGTPDINDLLWTIYGAMPIFAYRIIHLLCLSF